MATRLTGPQMEQLSSALRDAFNIQSLGRMLRFRLDKRLADISLADNLQQVVFDLISAGEAEGWTPQLITAARESVPGNPALLEFSQQFGLASTDKPRQEVERVIRDSNSFLDVDKWRTRLGEVEVQVCRIEIKVAAGIIYGTGFLLGPDVLITNYHLMEAVILGEQGRTTSRGHKGRKTDVILRFDYKQLSDGTTINSGTIYRLSEDWLIDQSPNNPADRLPWADELDYALLRIKGSPGNDPVGGGKEPGAPPRSWVGIPDNTYEFAPHSTLYIMQHPDAEPLKLALDTDAIIGLNENGTRVRYKTNTQGGSSGAPCFNQNWELVALHHSGDPNFDPDHRPEYNEGIPFTSILRLLDQRGKKRLLGNPV